MPILKVSSHKIYSSLYQLSKGGGKKLTWGDVKIQVMAIVKRHTACIIEMSKRSISILTIICSNSIGTEISAKAKLTTSTYQFNKF